MLHVTVTQQTCKQCKKGLCHILGHFHFGNFLSPKMAQYKLQSV